MKRIHLTIATLSLLFVLLPIVASPVARLVASDKPTSGPRAEILGQLDQLNKQILALEGAIPQGKFTWRPADGVRSISEVYLHIADANYLFLNATGSTPPVDMKTLMDQKKREGATTDKAKIAEALKASFVWTKEQIMKMSDADLEKIVDFFGRKATIRDVLVTGLGHCHEHLGQSIAYARMNGVVPPWTAERQARTESRQK